MSVVSDDLIIRVLDVENFKIVRRFEGHTNHISDLTFSPDCRFEFYFII